MLGEDEVLYDKKLPFTKDDPCRQFTSNIYAELLSPNDNIPIGSGRAYHLALRALTVVKAISSVPGSKWHDNLFESLCIFRRALAPYLGASVNAKDLCSLLHARFNIDRIIDFSGAWSYWDSLLNYAGGSPAPEPLDQQLFRGSHPHSNLYFDGISNLAGTHADKVSEWLMGKLPSSPVKTLIDLGAGSGTYAKSLVDNGLAVSATCVDFENVVLRAQRNTSEHIHWIPSDLFQLSLPQNPRFDLVYLGNVLHHYSLADSIKFLSRIAGNIDSKTYLVVQEYLVAERPEVPHLFAAILGVHFALTSDLGRCYSLKETSHVIAGALPGFRPLATRHLTTSDLILYGIA